MRPHIIINCAASADGKLALRTRRQTRISSEEDIARVHKLRASVDAILVGIGTVLADDPSLTVKEKYVPGAKNPMRVVLDSRGRTPVGVKVLDGKARTIIFTNYVCTAVWDGAESLRAGEVRVDARSALEALGEMGVKRLMVEGGGTVIWTFLREGLWDELKVFIGSIALGGGGPTLADGDGVDALEKAVRMRLERATPIDGGVLLEYVPHG